MQCNLLQIHSDLNLNKVAYFTFFHKKKGNQNDTCTYKETDIYLKAEVLNVTLLFSFLLMVNNR